MITGSKISHILLMNSVDWLIQALSTRKIVKKALKKDKNDIFHIYLGNIGKISSKKIA